MDALDVVLFYEVLVRLRFICIDELEDTRGPRSPSHIPHILS